METRLRKYWSAPDLGLLAGIVLAGAGVVLLGAQVWLWAAVALALAALVFLLRWEAGPPPDRRGDRQALRPSPRRRRSLARPARALPAPARARRAPGRAEPRPTRSSAARRTPATRTPPGGDGAGRRRRRRIAGSKETEIGALVKEMQERVRRAQAEVTPTQPLEAPPEPPAFPSRFRPRRGPAGPAGPGALPRAGSGAVSGRSAARARASAGARDDAPPDVPHLEHLIGLKTHGDREPCYNRGRSRPKTPGGERREPCIPAEIVPVVDARRICLAAALLGALVVAGRSGGARPVRLRPEGGARPEDLRPARRRSRPPSARRACSPPRSRPPASGSTRSAATSARSRRSSPSSSPSSPCTSAASARLEERVEEQTRGIEHLQTQFAIAQTRLEERLVELYQSEDTDAFAILLQVQSLGDLVDQLEYFESIGRRTRRSPSRSRPFGTS